MAEKLDIISGTQMIKRLGEHCNSFSFLFLFHYQTIQPTTEKMSAYIICCPICGWRIYDISAGWRNEFRGRESICVLNRVHLC